MIALFNIFLDVKLHNVVIDTAKPDEIRLIYVIGAFLCVIFSVASVGFHIHDFYDNYRFRRTSYGNIKAILLISGITFLLDYIVFFILVQNPIIGFSFVLFFIYYIVRFIWRLSSLGYANSGMYGKLFESLGDYYNQYEHERIRINDNKKEYLRSYNNKINIKYL